MNGITQYQRIPKLLHSIWIGPAEPPRLVLDCLASYQAHAADYQLSLWDDDRSRPVLAQYPFAQQAYDAGLYAFASDVIRLHALYQDGGIYLDSDLQLCKTLTPYLHHRFFAGLQDNRHVSTALLAAEPRHPVIGELLQYYAGCSFLDRHGDPDLTTITRRLTASLQRRGLIEADRLQQLDEGIAIYPREIFCPFHPRHGGEATPKTVAIHHYNGSWTARRKELKARRKERRRRRRAMAGGAVIAALVAVAIFTLLLP